VTGRARFRRSDYQISAEACERRPLPRPRGTFLTCLTRSSGARPSRSLVGTTQLPRCGLPGAGRGRPAGSARSDSSARWPVRRRHRPCAGADRPGGKRSVGRRLIVDANVLIAYERGTIDRAAIDADELAVAAVSIAEYRAGIELADTPGRAADCARALVAITSAVEVLSLHRSHGRLPCHP